ncbi:XdhC family protein [Sinisalibacter aestuarii]|uniref:XdhC/CoxI family protein n=1 Tax=Sinisalibacter aestuarii TaxID=2949426 RepID=A0ABQ5LZE9_9RHOB|nr:XdhC family protein [Sinisalibacter aestuarii]GKY90208.1 XdhC/CoxI family protein [Sinisalibacter aestuarii]
MTESYDDIPETALAWHRAGKEAVLATVVQTWGSAPRPVGSQLAISGAGEIQGSVSGGCVEGAVVTEALEALGDGGARLLSYGVSDETAFSVGLACGGTIRVLVEPVGAALPEAMLAEIVAARAARQPLAYVVNTESWVRRIAGPPAFAARFRADRSGIEEDDATFVAIHNPPLRMVIVGAVHIAQALVPMARIAGYDPVIIDPRGAFAAEHRFPGEDIREDFPDEVLPALGLDARTAVVTLSHDPKIDDPAIEAALGAEVFYLGSLGSTRTHARRVERLQAKGYTADQIARIHAPVGLDIGAKSPGEIAVSIMAQVTQRLRQG